MVAVVGEPSMAATLALPLSNITLQFRNQFPGASVQETEDGSFVAFTVHGIGATQEAAKEDSLKELQMQREHGKRLGSIIGEVRAGLTSPGMTRERHDALIALLDDAELALGRGLLCGVIAPINNYRLTRELADLRRRVTTRLGMAAQEIANEEKARKHAAAPVAPIATTFTQAIQTMLKAREIKGYR